MVQQSRYVPPTRREQAIRRAQGFTPTFKAEVDRHDQHILGRRTANRHTGITGGLAAGAAVGAAAGAFAGGVGAGPGAVFGAAAGALLGGLGGHAVGTVRKVRADLPFNKQHGISMRDHALVTQHNARLMSDPIYRAAKGADHHAVMRGRQPKAQTVSTAGVGGGIHRAPNGRFA